MRNYVHTYRIVEWYRQHSCYIMLLSNVYTLLKNLVGEEDRHIMFLISPISGYCYDLMKKLSSEGVLTLNLLTTTIGAPPSNASKWQMGFNSAFKGLMQ